MLNQQIFKPNSKHNIMYELQIILIFFEKKCSLCVILTHIKKTLLF